MKCATDLRNELIYAGHWKSLMLIKILITIVIDFQLVIKNALFILKISPLGIHIWQNTIKSG